MRTVGAYALICAPIIFYYLCIYIFAVNVPFADDYDSLRDHINFSSAKGTGERVSILFSQHNEHRQAYNRIVFVVYEFLFQEINYKFLPLIGNAALLFLLFFFWKNLQVITHQALVFVPIPLLLFQFVNWTNMTWTLAALSNLYVLCFAAISFYFLSKGNIKGYIPGFLFGAASVFTQGSGLGIFPVFWCYLLAVKKYRESFYWLAGFLVIAGFYFMGYETPEHHPSIWEALKHQSQLWGYFFSFLGGFLFFSKKMAFLGGFTFFLFFIFLTFKKYYLKRPALYLFLAFIFSVAGMAALARSGFGIDHALVPRYKIISILLAISFYIVVADWVFFSKKKERVFIAISIGISIISYFAPLKLGLYNLKMHSIGIVEGANYWASGINYWASKNNGLAYPRPQYANETLSLAMRKGIYRFPGELLRLEEQDFSTIQNPPKECKEPKENPAKLAMNLNIISGGLDDLLRFEGKFDQVSEMMKMDIGNTFFVLKSKEAFLYYSIPTLDYPGLSYKGFIGLIPSKKIKNGVFEAGVCKRGELQFIKPKVSVKGNQIRLLNEII